MAVVVELGQTAVLTVLTDKLACQADLVVVEIVITQVQTVAEVAYSLVSTRVLVKVITILAEIPDQLQVNPIAVVVVVALVALVQVGQPQVSEVKAE
jgi:hypothetical protein